MAYRPRLSHVQYIRHLELESWNNVLVIADLHSPFIKRGYLEHCKKQQDRFNCERVVFIGDVADNHYSSYHETDPDGLSAGGELKAGVRQLKEWHANFPGAKVTIGNHDMMAMRKAFTAGLSKNWIRGLAEVLETPTWDFVDEVIIDGVLYTHGTGQGGERPAFLRALHRRVSCVMGHVHTVANVTWSASAHDKIFGMQVGCGVDEKAYAFEYGRTYAKKMVVSCGVVLNNGKLPLVIPMDLG